MRRRLTSPVLVGRAEELSELLAALAAAADGRGGIVLVEGEAGIGKSRLVDELVIRARATGAVVLAGACLPFADAVPYAPLAPILGHLTAASESEGRTDHSVETSDRFRFFQWMADRLADQAVDRPVVVVIEDLHWADESTGDLLLFVANAVRSARVLLVATRRPGERDRSSGLSVALGELARSGRAQRIELTPLRGDEVGELIGQIIGVEPSLGLVERVVGRAEGNPFFAEELVAAGGGEDLPTTVGDLVLQRVARLAPETRRLLRVAAVIGRRVGYALLGEVASIDAAAIDAALGDAVEQQLLVVSGDHYAFRHALGHEAVYGDLRPGERAALHGRVAEVLTNRPDLALDDDPAMAPGELAHHWHAAGRVPEALAASVRAGRAAEAAYAPIEAYAQYRRAIELWPRVADAAARAGTDRAWLLEHAADAASLAGSHHAAVQLADQLVAELDATAEPERHARILDRRALFLWHAGDRATSKQATAALRRTVESGVTLATVTRLCGIAYQSALAMQYLDALALARDALAAAEKVGGSREVGYALHVLGSLEGHLGRYEDGIDRLRRSLAIAVEDGDPQRIGASWHNLVEANVFAGDAEHAAALAERGLADLRRRGMGRTYGTLTAGQLAYALLALGRWDDADARIAEVLDGDPDPYFALPVGYARLQLLCRRGHFAETEAATATLVDRFGDHEYTVAMGAAWRAEAALWQHEWDAARSALAKADEVIGPTDEIMLELRLAALAIRLEADELAWGRLSAAPGDAVAAGRSAHARLDRVAGSLERVEAAVQCCSRPLRHQLAIVRAELSRLDEVPPAQPWAEVASTGAEPYLVAYARWREAEALLATGTRDDRVRAEGVLRDGATLAHSVGAEPLATEVADLARRARIDLDPDSVGDRPTATGRDTATTALTARELEVLRLLGRGLSNREIGEALFISAKTASVHVTHIFQKLNVTTRVQAAVAANRMPE